MCLIAIGKIVPQWEFVGYSVYRQCVRCVDGGRKRAGASQGRDNFTELMTVFPWRLGSCEDHPSAPACWREIADYTVLLIFLTSMVHGSLTVYKTSFDPWMWVKILTFMPHTEDAKNLLTTRENLMHRGLSVALAKTRRYYYLTITRGEQARYYLYSSSAAK